MLRYKSKEKPFDLDWQYLLKLFNDAHGLCFYTDIQMNVNAGGRDRSSVSVDKLIPDKGYVKGNVVLCTRRANLIKNDLTIEELKRWMPDWHSRIRRFYNADINNGI